MTLRAAGKLCWFLGEVAIVVMNYVFTTAFVSKKSKRRAQAAWLHYSARRHIKIYGCDYRATGPIPQKGLLVLNHLSYLDILVIAALTPAIFVSKSEVRDWPLFGWLASLGGTLFIKRARRTHVGVINREIETALADGVLVVVFPEGTSTNGGEVLPFRSPLLEPVSAGTHPISVGYLGTRARKYAIGEITPSFRTPSICWANGACMQTFNLDSSSGQPTTARNWPKSCARRF